MTLRTFHKNFGAVALAVAVGFGGSIALSPAQSATAAPVEDEQVAVDTIPTEEPNDDTAQTPTETEPSTPTEPESPESPTPPGDPETPEPTETAPETPPTQEPAPDPTPAPEHPEEPTAPVEPIEPRPEPEPDPEIPATHRPDNVVMTLAKTRVSQSESLTGINYEGRGFSAGDVKIEVSLADGSVVLVDPTAAADDGSFHGTLTYVDGDGAELSMPVGTHSLVVTQEDADGATVLSEAQFQVMPDGSNQAAGVTPTTASEAGFGTTNHEGGLAETGADDLGVGLVAGVALLLAGAGALWHYRRTA